VNNSGSLAVLVHGAWHSSVHWAATQRALAHHGVAGIAVDLPGHGVNAPVPSGYLCAGQPGLATEKSALTDITMQDLADTVLEVLAGVRPRFARVVLVAHSAGGGPSSLAAEQAPELVDHLVYLSAFVPAGRPRFTDYINAPENAAAIKLPMVGEPDELGAHRINPLSPNTEDVETIRRAFLNDLPLDAPEGWRHLLHPDEPYANLTAPVSVSRERWGRIPRTYIRLIDDLALPLVTQDLMITEADRFTPDTPFAIRSLPGGHSPMAVRPAELAETLAAV
jgi:pimeloyl-ACP methyl ester carboxylesterase